MTLEEIHARDLANALLQLSTATRKKDLVFFRAHIKELRSKHAEEIWAARDLRELVRATADAHREVPAAASIASRDLKELVHASAAERRATQVAYADRGITEPIPASAYKWKVAQAAREAAIDAAPEAVRRIIKLLHWE